MNKVTYMTSAQIDDNQAKALKNNQTREADQLKKSQRRDAIDLVMDQHENPTGENTLKTSAALALKQSQEEAAIALKISNDEAAEILKEAKSKHKSDADTKDDIIGWMAGDYSTKK